MGGAVKSVGNIISAPASIAGAIPGVGKVLGPVVGGITGGPVGFATSLAGQALTGAYSGGGGGGGGGGGSIPTYGSTDASGNLTPATPGFNYGANTYTYGDKPYDASNYFVEGNKGVYNTLPTLGSNYNPSLPASDPSNIQTYQSLTNSMQGDPTALANFQKQFAPQTTYSNYKPIAYADFGLTPGSTQFELSQYASKNKNPGFVGFQTPLNQAIQEAAQQVPSQIDQMRSMYRPVESQQRGPAPRDNLPTTIAAFGGFRPTEGGSATATQAAQQQPGAFKPVNIRTGGLASLRRSK
jgi:hypothetical protein